jgi:protein SCO1/2
MTRRRVPVGIALVAHILFGVTLAPGSMLSAEPTHADSSPVTIGGPFTLVAPDGTTVTDQTYRGKWLLVYFGFTYCPSSCPTTLLEVASALEKLGADAAEVQPLFITVDPQRDTREVLEDYTRSFDPRIVGLTGSPGQIAAIAKEYGVYYGTHRTGPGAEDYVLDHSTYLYLMDPRGQFARAFDADESGDRIADAVRKRMAQSGESGSRRNRENGHAKMQGSK